MSGRLHVALVNNYGGADMGGGEVQSLALVTALTQRDVDVTVACAEGSAFEHSLRRLPGVDVVPCSFGGSALVRLPGLLAKRFRGAHLVQGTGFLTNLLARRIGAIGGIPVINVVQVTPGAERFETGVGTGTLVRRVLGRYRRDSVARYVVPSASVRDALVRQGVRATAVSVVPNGIDGNALAASAEAPPPYDPDAVGSPRIGYAGRLARVKGCDLFLRAAALLAEAHPSASFLIAGSGQEEARLRALADTLGIAPRVTFLGYVDDVAPFLRSLDVVVVPSLSEAFGLTALEAQALGRPVVASAVGGLTDIVAHGESGLLVPAGDPGAIADAVARLVDDPAYAHRLGEAGSRRAHERFALEPMVQGYLDVYSQTARC